MKPCSEWNIPSRVEQEEKDMVAKEASENETIKKDRIEYERLQKIFGNK